MRILLAGALAILWLQACGDDDDDSEVRGVTIKAETTIEDPVVSFVQEGDFISPDRNEYEFHASNSLESGDRQVDAAVVVIGDQAWVSNGFGWDSGPVDDPNISIRLGPGMGKGSWYWGLDFSEIHPQDWPQETVNGIATRKVSLASGDPESCARVFGSVGEDLEGPEGVEECTFWLAEDGLWPVAMRLTIEGSDLPFAPGEGQEEPFTDDVPPMSLGSFHYKTVIAGKELPGEAGSESYRLEWIAAISQVNDENIEIVPPEG
jgi:hypothetical protein